jgi:hypothetical protein
LLRAVYLLLREVTAPRQPVLVLEIEKQQQAILQQAALPTTKSNLSDPPMDSPHIAPPYMVGVPVAQYNPPGKAPSVPKPTPIPHEPSRMFANPILTGFNPEPSITRVGEDFFMTTATFEYFPGLPIYHSNDLLNWELVGHALTRRNQLDLGAVESGAEIRAPTLRHMNGIFYLTACKWDLLRAPGKECYDWLE